MNVERDPDAILATWLDDGPTRLPDGTRRAIGVATRSTDQRRRPFRRDHRPRSAHRGHPRRGHRRGQVEAVAAVPRRCSSCSRAAPPGSS